MASLITKNGNYFARIRYTVDGKRREKRVSLGTKQKAKANRLLERINHKEELYRGGVLSVEDVALTETLPIDDFIRDFKDYLVSHNRSEKTLQLYTLSLDAFKRFLGNQDLSLLRKRDLVRFMEWMKNEYPNINTLNMRLRNIKAFFRWLVENDALEEAPFAIKQLQVEERLPKYFTSSEVDQILQAADETGNNELYSRIVLHLNTGMRIGEVANSYLDKGFVHIYRSKAKRERTVPIDEETANHYRVCCDGEYTTGTISKQFHAILKDLGYDRTPDGGTRNFHCLRHTFAVRQYAKTGDIYLVSKLLGHSSVKTTERYARFDLQMLYQDFPECDIMRG